MSARPRVLALSGGVGGAKLLLGLQAVLEPGALAAIVNTADDFEHLGLRISPDLDTTMYTLAGLADPDRGWGRAEESWNFMAEIERLGGESWFRLGDRDLAVHVERTRRLARGEALSSITRDIGVRIGVASRLVPMSDERVRTRVLSDQGELDFQDYFVRRRCAPRVRALRYEGAAQAAPVPEALEWLRSGTLGCVVIAPSNPWLSIDPILALPALAAALRAARAPVVAVSPLIGGRAVKGPTAKIMAELGLVATNAAIAGHYAPYVDGLIIDEADAHEIAALGLPTLVTRTLMQDMDDRIRLAQAVLDFAIQLSAGASWKARA